MASRHTRSLLVPAAAVLALLSPDQSMAAPMPASVNPSRPVAAAAASSLNPSRPPAAPAKVSPIKPEGLVPGPPVSGTHKVANQEPTIVMQAGKRARVAGAQSVQTALEPALYAFLTRPYTTWHTITSAFDHCNPDYTQDNKVCRFDGSVGLRSYGVDPSFSLGYAQSPGGSDYLYYDGHNGWDYALAYENVLASGEGTVQLAGSDPFNPCFGQTITIDHLNGFSTRYAHLSAIYVASGSSVRRGQVIAQSGNTGCSSGAHLHFGVYLTSSWTAVDPWGWQGPGPDPWSSDDGNLWLTGTGQFPIPGAPTSVTAKVGSSTSALVQWVPPAWDGGSGIIGYTITSVPGGITASVNGSALNGTVSGLTVGGTYSFTVTASNAVGSGGASSPSNNVTLGLLPSQPLSVVAAPRDGSAIVAWQPPTSDGGAPISSYTVTAAPGSASVKTADGARSALVTGLTNGTSYILSVTATNGVGQGPASAATNSVTPGTPAWASLGGTLGSAPDVVSWGPGRLDVFARGITGSVIHTWNDSAGWHPWESLAGPLDSRPSVASWGPGRLDIFARSTGGSLMHKWYDGTAWHTWESLGGTLTARPEAVAWGTGRLDVFSRTAGNALIHTWYDAAGWHAWESLGGQLGSDLSITSWAPGRIDLFVRGLDGALMHRFYNSAGWSAWEALGGSLNAAPAAAAWGPSRLDIFAQLTNGTLGHRSYNGGGWDDWESFATPPSADLTAASSGVARVDLFTRGGDGRLYQLRQP